MPRSFRMALRRFLAKRLIRSFSASWPINQLAGAPPRGWTGWPDNKKFAFVLTHDIEGERGLKRCGQLAEMEISTGFRSSFNFVPEGEYTTPQYLREFLAANGFEVGVHDLSHDGKLYASHQNFRRHAIKINRYLQEWGAVGFRSAFMLHNFDWIGELDVLYDASSFDTDPFEPQPDGVNTIFPIWVGREARSGYVELPYTLPQDSTVFLLLQQCGIETWVKKLDWVAQYGGLALVNVHPDYLNFNGCLGSYEYGAHLYLNFLEYVSKRYGQEAWFALPKDVAAHVRCMYSSLAAAPCARPSLEQTNSRSDRGYDEAWPVTFSPVTGTSDSDSVDEIEPVQKAGGHSHAFCHAASDAPQSARIGSSRLPRSRRHN